MKSDYRDVFFHPSSLSACARKTFFGYFKAPKDAVIQGEMPDVARTLRIFKNGDDLHLRMQVLFVRMGLCGLDDIEVPFQNGDEQGTADAIATVEGRKYIVDFKSINNARFARLIREGIDEGYEMQIRTYMRNFEISRSVFIYECKNCVPDYSRALTRNGWKYRNQLRKGDEILTFNPKEQKTEWQRINNLIEFDFDSKKDGFLFQAGNKHNSFVSTANHRWYVKHNKGCRLDVKYSKNLNSNDWIPRVSKYGNSISDEKSVLTPSESKIFGLVVTDGWINKEGCVYICQKVGKQADLIRKLIEKTKTEFSEYTTEPSKQYGTIMKYFNIRGFLKKKIRKIYNSKNDLIPILFKLSPNALKACKSGMLFGDGSWSCSGVRQQFCQRDGPIKEGFQILCFLLGQPFNINANKLSGYIGLRPYMRAFRPKRVAYKGKVWCPSVSNKAWVMEQNGKVIITGNTQQLHEIFVFANEDRDQDVQDRLDFLRETVKNKELPEKEGEDPKRVPCSYCHYCSLCWSENREKELSKWAKNLKKCP